LFTRVLPNDHLLCLVFIRPSIRAAEFEGLMQRVLSSLSINDQAVGD
jgi:hypothetical protein